MLISTPDKTPAVDATTRKIEYQRLLFLKHTSFIVRKEIKSPSSVCLTTFLVCPTKTLGRKYVLSEDDHRRFYGYHTTIFRTSFGIFQIVFEVMQQNYMRRAGLLSQTLDIVRRLDCLRHRVAKYRPFVLLCNQDNALIGVSLKFRIYTRRKNLVKTEKCTSTWARSCPIS